jgi:hypothetical protein
MLNETQPDAREAACENFYKALVFLNEVDAKCDAGMNAQPAEYDEEIRNLLMTLREKIEARHDQLEEELEATDD